MSNHYDLIYSNTQLALFDNSEAGRTFTEQDKNTIIYNYNGDTNAIQSLIDESEAEYEYLEKLMRLLNSAAALKPSSVVSHVATLHQLETSSLLAKIYTNIDDRMAYLENWLEFLNVVISDM